MFGGHSGYHQEEQRGGQHDMSYLPHLQLFGKCPVGYTLDNINFVRNDQTMASSRPIKRAREQGPMLAQQKSRTALNNFCHDTMNTNPVSTGLKLSYEEDHGNSSVTSISENMKALQPINHSLADSIKLEMGRQKQVIDHYVKVQEENIIKGIRDLNQKHTASLLNTLEKEVTKKLNEKDTEIVNMNRRNMELGLKIKQVAMEAQSWHYRAKYNESVVNTLKSNLQEVIASKPLQEGYGDSEVDDAASYTNVNALGNPYQTYSVKSLLCKACNAREVCVLILPCRHLCLCKECEVLTENCPICQDMKTESVQVFLS